MTLQTIETATEGRIALIRFNRPDQLNAMSTPMIAEIVAELDRAEADTEVAAIILTGAGRAFMAGADLKEYSGFDNEAFRAFQVRGRRVYERIEQNRKIVVAAVNGYALGGGFEMVLASDLVVARRGARMGLPEVKLGLVPGGGGTQRLAGKIGPNRALEVLASGRHRPAEDFEAWGLVNELADDDVVDSARALLEPMVQHPALALEGIKSLLRLSRQLPLAAGLDAEAEVLQALFESPAGQARIRDFVGRSKRD